ncbi:hypothetical protein [Paraburkholderia lacunae]|uniref:Uncharacterized protein n=1 Tax=Paraburkholderia lacunae TaxID=2211104 RepID=A0A370NFW5_9BURK|nr:hypothetical protein [Paraburkholderia lacunae]RDK04481.1 hypothetical protein DLM46_00985 [Paraburkholderia lacunae]
MEKIRTFVGNLLGTVAVGTGLWIATVDHVAAATACMSAGILILLLANINHFEFIKGFGFEAKTKKLDEKIEEADRLLSQLRLASQLFADISVQLMSRAGRWAGPIPKAETQDLVTRIQALLESLDVKSAEIDKSLDPFHRITLRDLATSGFNAFFAELERRTTLVNDAMGQRAADEQSRTGVPIPSDDPQHLALQAEWEAIRQFAQETRQKFESADPFTLGTLLEQSVKSAPSWMDSERRAFLAAVKPTHDEWKFYAKHRRINDVGAWLAREYGH